FFIKLDVQGAEPSALSGARQTLRDTHVVLCETSLTAFQDVNRILAAADFFFYDALSMGRGPQGELVWFYPMYVKSTLAVVQPKKFWTKAEEAGIVQAQDKHRQANLQHKAAVLERIRKAKMPPTPAIGRNSVCACGSGRRYKHCCGAHTV